MRQQESSVGKNREDADMMGCWRGQEKEARGRRSNALLERPKLSDDGER